MDVRPLYHRKKNKTEIKAKRKLSIETYRHVGKSRRIMNTKLLREVFSNLTVPALIYIESTRGRTIQNGASLP